MQSWIPAPLTYQFPLGTIVGVGRPSQKSTPASYKAAFIERTRLARRMFSEEPIDMAKALGIAPGTYTRYETRNMLPHRYIGRFVELTGVKYDFLMNGAGRMASSMTGLSPQTSE